MKIRKANIADLDILLKMYENARKFMTSHGNPTQWGNSYPSKTLVAQDIEEGNSYACEEHGKIIAAFYYKEGKDDTYAKIYNGQWLSELPYGVVHRIISDGTIRGAASFCLNWAFEQCGNLRIDTHRDNIVMQHIMDKNGFKYCGIIYMEDGSERLAYQKVL
ncbi:GNAT family N-acetyltransferase [Faecalicatena contorta]|uniref:Protein N-acetyltransferase, RimJ/RimL family n=1 Tax=Faecalicatena contorta TaxID=39482 RepID=A0A315ZNK2_9FIRM|nr:GNAT family protein [Faecalicatena contorta]PWJ47086.1 RimJ/RimL family protein N-acetyltransferase [Faecalicatena contorta]SUQ16187.1 Protein N-acetyltransferase, RimJ/RimL family [Faecalicatena contorta]